MLSALKFVKGAVAKKDYQPALTHFRIKNGTVMGYNGIIALSSPIDLDIDATPKALHFVNAIERCQSETTVIHMTPGGKLSLRSGKFKAFIECTDDGEILDTIIPEGEEHQAPEGLVAAMKVLEPFVGIDASRPWATGLLLRDNSAFATNNIVLTEYWIGSGLPFDVNIPSQAIRELVRIGKDPEKIMIGERSMTFFYAEDQWVRFQLLDASWPDVTELLNLKGDLKVFPPEFFTAVDTLAPFVEMEGRVYFREGLVSTSIEDGQGASVEISGIPDKGAYHYKHLLSLENVAVAIDFNQHPQPCPFSGERLRGVLLGMVDA